MSAASLVVEQRSAVSAPVRLLRRIFSFPVMLAGILTVLAVLTVRSRFDDPDMWWHLKTGEVIWKSHSIPTTDIFSYTTNHHAWVPHEWLSQVLIYGAYRFGGYSGLMLWLCFFSAALLIAGYALCSLYSGNAKVAFLGALLIWFFSTIGLAVRGQMVGYLLLVIELLLMHLGRTRGSRWFFFLPPLFALWINCHASFILGFAVAMTFLFCSIFDFRLGSLVATRWDWIQIQMLALAIILSAAALFLNPLGLKQILYPLGILHPSVGLDAIQEFAPLAMNSMRGIGILGLLTGIFLLVAIRRPVLFWDEFLLLAMGTWLAVSHQRMVFAFGILAAPILSRLLSTSWDGYRAEQDRPLPNAIFLAASLLLAVWAFPSSRDLASQTEQKSPVKAVEFVKSHHLSGNMLNEYVDGGYLIWAAPEHPVFVDGNADSFALTGVLGDFANWTSLKSDPNELLNKYRIGFCLLSRESPMARVLPLLPGWKTVYTDNLSVIIMRTAGSFVQ